MRKEGGKSETQREPAGTGGLDLADGGRELVR